MTTHCHIGVCSSPVHCREIQRCFSTPRLNKPNEGPGSPKARFTWLMDELEKRFPHPKPFDSTKVPELYMIEAIDELRKKYEQATTDKKSE